MLQSRRLICSRSLSKASRAIIQTSRRRFFLVNNLKTLNFLKLSPSDHILAAVSGKRRFEKCRANGQVHLYDRPEGHHTIGTEVAAVGAEIFCARLMGLPWSDAGHPDKSGDIAPGLQVRHTKHFDGCLILHHEDIDWHIFMFAVGKFPTYACPGWMICSEGKQERFWTTRTQRPAFFVPQSHLRSLMVLLKAPSYIDFFPPVPDGRRREPTKIRPKEHTPK